MARKRWTTERKMQKVAIEKFEELLYANGYKVNAVREYVYKIDYLIEKKGKEKEFDFLIYVDSEQEGIWMYEKVRRLWNKKEIK